MTDVSLEEFALPTITRDESSEFFRENYWKMKQARCCHWYPTTEWSLFISFPDNTIKCRSCGLEYDHMKHFAIGHR